MASQIDDTKPEHGQATTASVRDNFKHAKDEIETLQHETEELQRPLITDAEALAPRSEEIRSFSPLMARKVAFAVTASLTHITDDPDYYNDFEVEIPGFTGNQDQHGMGIRVMITNDVWARGIYLPFRLRVRGAHGVTGFLQVYSGRGLPFQGRIQRGTWLDMSYQYLFQVRTCWQVQGSGNVVDGAPPPAPSAIPYFQDESGAFSAPPGTVWGLWCAPPSITWLNVSTLIGDSNWIEADWVDEAPHPNEILDLSNSRISYRVIGHITYLDGWLRIRGSYPVEQRDIASIPEPYTTHNNPFALTAASNTPGINYNLQVVIRSSDPGRIQLINHNAATVGDGYLFISGTIRNKGPHPYL